MNNIIKFRNSSIDNLPCYYYICLNKMEFVCKEFNSFEEAFSFICYEKTSVLKPFYKNKLVTIYMGFGNFYENSHTLLAVWRNDIPKINYKDSMDFLKNKKRYES